jgi:hypothetical protein
MSDTSTTTSSTTSTSTDDRDDATTDDLERYVDLHLAAYCDPGAASRLAAMRVAWSADGRLVDPPMEATGHEAIAGLADVVVTHYPGHTFRRTTAIDRHHEYARYGWALVAPDGTEAVSGLDVVRVAPDGRLGGIVGFFGELTPR